MTLLFLDTNVPMYASGGQHRLKEPSLEVLRLAARYPESFITDAEVLQEILHRGLALRRAEAGRSLVSQFVGVMRGRIEPVYAGDVEEAAVLSEEYPELTARDLLHAAIIRRLQVDGVVTADAGFERLRDFTRLDPLDVEDWAAALGIA